MRKITLIRGARQLLTLRGPDGPRRGAELGNLGLIHDGAVLLADGLVLEVGPSRRVENLALARQAEEIDASGCVVLPGFVDSNVQIVGGPLHPGEDGPNSFSSRGAARSELHALANAKSLHALSFRALESIALRRVEQAVRHGTTALEAKSGVSLTDAGETKTLRVHAAMRGRLPVVSTLLCVRPHLGQDLAEYVGATTGRLLPRLRRRKFAEFVEIRPSAEVPKPYAARLLNAARDLGFGLKVYAGPDSRDAVPLAQEAGAAVIDDLVEVSDAEARLLASSQIVATLSPTPDVANASYDSRARTLIDGGAAIALATNYRAGGNPSLNLQMTIALACRAFRLTAAEAISAATINGAHALRRASRIGSIETGKDADILLLSIPDYRELPYHFGVNLVDAVIQRGTVITKRSEVTWATP